MDCCLYLWTLVYDLVLENVSCLLSSLSFSPFMPFSVFLKQYLIRKLKKWRNGNFYLLHYKKRWKRGRQSTNLPFTNLAIKRKKKTIWGGREGVSMGGLSYSGGGTFYQRGYIPSLFLWVRSFIVMCIISVQLHDVSEILCYNTDRHRDILFLFFITCQAKKIFKIKILGPYKWKH